MKYNIDRKKIAETISMYRAKKRLSQKQMGKRLGMSAPTISRMEMKDNSVSTQTILLALKGLNVDPEIMIKDFKPFKDAKFSNKGFVKLSSYNEPEDKDDEMHRLLKVSTKINMLDDDDRTLVATLVNRLLESYE